jgi:hypothetical protein
MKEELFAAIYGLVGVLLGAYCALGIWFPRLRMRWKGASATAGPVNCAGFALAFTSGGSLVAGLQQGSVWFLFSALNGFILAGVGYALDAGAQSPNSAVRPGESFSWGFAAFAALFLLLVASMVLFHQ